MKARKFRLHFNRINMQRGLETVWTIHLSNQCIPARVVHLKVPVDTVFKPQGRQPRAWFAGKGVIENLYEDVWIITPAGWREG